MISRRRALRMLGAASAAAALGPVELARARAAYASCQAAGSVSALRFFTAHEHATVRLLADMVIPADGRSGSATDAEVPEFMDFILSEYANQAVPIRGGLAWLDYQSLDRFGARFVACSEPQRRELLDKIAWPERAPRQLRHGVAFFNRFRDLVASGFWSSKIGVDDLQYVGNVFAPRWQGCPPAQLRKLGLLD